MEIFDISILGNLSSISLSSTQGTQFEQACSNLIYTSSLHFVGCAQTADVNTPASA